MIYLRHSEKVLATEIASRRHSREGGNPECVTPEKSFYYRSHHWIPAFAGMTSLLRAQRTKFIGASDVSYRKII
jgi:hypothetical protein